MNDCIFCKIIKGEMSSYKIYENSFTYAFLDISNDANGHILVVPKVHTVNVLDCDTQVLAHVMETVKKIANHLVDNCGFDGVNILNASGKSAEQSVNHLHFHILPRRNNDGLHIFPVLPQNQESLQSLCEKLRLQK